MDQPTEAADSDTGTGMAGSMGDQTAMAAPMASSSQAASGGPGIVGLPPMADALSYSGMGMGADADSSAGQSSMDNSNGSDSAGNMGGMDAMGAMNDTGMQSNMNAHMDSSAMADAGNGTPAFAPDPAPVTEDTAAPSMPSFYDPIAMDSSNTAASGQAQDDATSMPGVMAADGAGTSETDNADMFEAVPVESSMDAGQAGTTGMGADMGAPVSAGDADAGGTAWATEALGHLEVAQQAMASGDWSGFGQAMNTLKSALQSAASGTAGAGAAGAMSMQPATQAPSMGESAQSAPAMTNDAGAGDQMAGADAWGSSAAIAEPAPAVPSYVAGGQSEYDGMDTAAGMSAMGAASMPAPQIEQGAPVAMGMAAASAANDAPDQGMARLVVISTGAELPMPEQEEITVGREDPSSGIFPDVDLTPYGGEDGGVSRRHARMLHIGDDYFVEDLQSTNYTKLDGQRLPAHVRERLEDGARLDFGRVAVIFRRS